MKYAELEPLLRAAQRAEMRARDAKMAAHTAELRASEALAEAEAAVAPLVALAKAAYEAEKSAAET